MPDTGQTYIDAGASVDKLSLLVFSSGLLKPLDSPDPFVKIAVMTDGARSFTKGYASLLAISYHIFTDMSIAILNFIRKI